MYSERSALDQWWDAFPLLRGNIPPFLFRGKMYHHPCNPEYLFKVKKNEKIKYTLNSIPARMQTMVKP